MGAKAELRTGGRPGGVGVDYTCGPCEPNALASGSWLGLASGAEPAASRPLLGARGLLQGKEREPAASAVGSQDFCKPGIGTMPAKGKTRGGDSHCATLPLNGALVSKWRKPFDIPAEGLVSEESRADKI